MKTISVKSLIIGTGIPKIAVPIIANTKQEIIKKAKSLDKEKIDIVEWRADFYKDVFDIKEVLKTLSELSATIRNIPLIFTFRTKKEGGEKEISMDYYTALNKAVAESGNVDLIDIEILSNEMVVKQNIKNIHKADVFVIGSNHDFLRTPEKEDMMFRLKKIESLGVDILKLAVMPRSIEDVLSLLWVTNDIKKHTKKPIITIAMGPLGVISRISGEFFGSAMTFGAMGEVSAKGQMPVEELFNTLKILHDKINNSSY